MSERTEILPEDEFMRQLRAGEPQTMEIGVLRCTSVVPVRMTDESGRAVLRMTPAVSISYDFTRRENAHLPPNAGGTAVTYLMRERFLADGAGRVDLASSLHARLERGEIDGVRHWMRRRSGSF